MAGMDAQGFAGREVARHNLTAEFDEGLTISAELLQEKSIPAENAGA